MSMFWDLDQWLTSVKRQTGIRSFTILGFSSFGALYVKRLTGIGPNAFMASHTRGWGTQIWCDKYAARSISGLETTCLDLGFCIENVSLIYSVSKID